MMDFLTGPHGRLNLALLLLLSGCAAKAVPTAAPSPEAPAAAASPAAETAAALPAAPVAVEQAAPQEVPPVPSKIDPCQQEQTLTTANACADFLRTCPSNPKRQDILVQMCGFIEKKKGGYEDYRKFVLEFGDGMQFVPYRHRLLLTGPEGMRVHDCVESLKAGEEHGVVLEKVRRQNAVYRDFTLQEIDTLKEMGLSGDIIQAMIESTLEAERAGRTSSNRAGGPYQSGGEAAGVSMRRESAYTSGEQTIYTPAPAAAPSGQYVPSAGQTIANCAAQAAALDACNRLSGLARTICNATAKAQFPCQ